MTTIQFTDNYSDLSSNRGFQFKFFCQKCGNGYMSTFKPNALGTAAAAAGAVQVSAISCPDCGTPFTA